MEKRYHGVKINSTHFIQCPSSQGSYVEAIETCTEKSSAIYNQYLLQEGYNNSDVVYLNPWLYMYIESVGVTFRERQKSDL